MRAACEVLHDDLGGVSAFLDPFRIEFIILSTKFIIVMQNPSLKIHSPSFYPAGGGVSQVATRNMSVLPYVEGTGPGPICVKIDPISCKTVPKQ